MKATYSSGGSREEAQGGRETRLPPILKPNWGPKNPPPPPHPLSEGLVPPLYGFQSIFDSIFVGTPSIFESQIDLNFIMILYFEW